MTASNDQAGISAAHGVNAPIRRVEVAAYRIPTEAAESDGTIEWNATTLITVHVEAAEHVGFGYSFAPAAAAHLIRDALLPVVRDRDAIAIEALWQDMGAAVRNAGRPGVASEAISAVDVALWDLKARILDLPLVRLWGALRDGVPLYASGGFTSYSDDQLHEQLAGWAADGFTRVKMKIGREPDDDLRRAAIARRAIGDNVDLFVDANGAFHPKQALRLAHRLAQEVGVVWFEEPCTSDNLNGLRLLCERGPAGMDIAAGEYGYTPWYFRRMLEARSVDCLQADATRCGGFTGFFKAAMLCEAFHVPLSAHCAPQLHAHVGCSVPRLQHVEYFHDHVRIAEMLFEGASRAVNGRLSPDPSQPGHGMSLKRPDAEKFAV